MFLKYLNKRVSNTKIALELYIFIEKFANASTSLHLFFW